MSSATTHPVLVGLVYFLMTAAVSAFIAVITTFLIAITSGFSTYGEVSAFTGFLTSLLSLLSSFLFYILLVGVQSYSLRTIRHQEAGIGYLFFYFRYFFKLLGLTIVVSVRTLLWTMLFVVPGIIATFRYSQAYFIFIDDPSKSISQCIDESSQIMNGHKWDYFVLQLSFILWGFLGAVTCGLASIYVFPYRMLTNAVFYDNLKYIAEAPYEQPQAPQMNQ